MPTGSDKSHPREIAMPAPDAPDVQDLLRRLPAVDALLNHPAIASLLADYPRSEVVHAVRAVLDERRLALRGGRPAALDTPALALDIRERLYERARPHLRRVINATGIVLHTGLGRAPLAREAIAALAEVAAGYCNLELDLDSGRRGDRHEHVRELLRELTGAEDALVVNNNAAATYLALNTLAAGREVIVSRGQLVEIGGSYRLPDIVAAAQCRMREVGTTNRTRISDYERALSDATAVLLRVHPSNYRIVGFTESAALTELVELARRHNLLVVDDLGSGLLSTDLPWPDSAMPVLPALRQPGPRATGSSEAQAPATDTARLPALWDEPTVTESLGAGADLALFSGDKLLGGPQAGIIVGRADLVAALRHNPLARTFRPGKLTLSALEATLRLYRDPRAALERIPAWHMLSRTPAELEQAARRLAEGFTAAAPGLAADVEPDHFRAGGGSLAARPFPTWVAVVRPGAAASGVGDERPAVAALAEALRRHDPPILCRVRDDALVFDPRTLDGDDGEQIAAALGEVSRELGGA